MLFLPAGLKLPKFAGALMPSTTSSPTRKPMQMVDWPRSVMMEARMPPVKEYTTGIRVEKMAPSHQPELCCTSKEEQS